MLERFSVSLEQELVRSFDRLIRQQQYHNRSEALRHLIRKSLVQEEWTSNAEVVGVISLVYDHTRRELQKRLTEAQHDQHDLITSTTHIHLDHDNCLEVVIARGRAADVKQLADTLTAIRGVKNGSLNMASTGKKIS